MICFAPRKRVGVTLLAALMGSGCAVKSSVETRNEYDQALQRSGEWQSQARRPQQQVPLVVSDTVSRFARRSIPLQRASTLPTHIGTVSMRYPGRHSLATVAELLSRLIDIPVIMTPDALAGAARYAPSGGQSGGAGAAMPVAPAGGQPAAAPGAPGSVASPAAIKGAAVSAGAKVMEYTAEELQNTLELNYSGTLAGLLDQIATRADLQWDYQEGKIVFSRVVTRAIALKSLPNGLSVKGDLSMTSSGGGSGGAGGGGGGGSISVSYDVQSDYWAELPSTLKSMLSPSAFLKADPKSGIVTVTDALGNVERVEAYLRSFNIQLLRQVVLELEVLTVDFTDSYNNGIDWNAVIQRAGNTFTITAPKGVPAGAGTVGFNFELGRAGSDAAVGAKPSNFIAGALQKYGRVSTSYSSVVTTTNRMPVPLGSSASQTYVSAVSPSVTNPNGTVVSGSIVPSSVSTGFNMVLTPVILDSNRILLQTLMQISSLTAIDPFGEGQLKVQLPRTAQFSTLQRASVQAGNTLVLVGYEREQAQSDESDVVRGFLPISRGGTRSKTGTVILITPRLADS
jgi:type IVB pilus formation R64 PilN family outer membrane protein